MCQLLILLVVLVVGVASAVEQYEGYLLPKLFGNYTIDDLKTSASCGQYMSSYSGITAYSNGGNQGTGYSCAGCGSTGCYYQCVEYVQRYFNSLHGIQAVWPVSYASQMCSAHPSGVSVVSSPQAGDAVVFPWAPYGHTAIVTSVSGGNINVVEQNASPSGTNTYAISGASCFLRAGGGGGGSCPTGGYYCGNDRLGLGPNDLYYCSGGGATPSLSSHCSVTCVSMPQGTDDRCASSGSCAGLYGWYCGNDRVNGDANTNYNCNNGGNGATYCSNGCHIASEGNNDYCN
jgi:surface antigen